MFLELICIACGAGLAIPLSLVLVHHPWDFYIPILLFIGGWIAGVGVCFLVELLACSVVSQKKEYKTVSKWSTFWFNNGIRFIQTHAHILVKGTDVDKIPLTEKFMLVCNHRSKFDNFIITTQLRKRRIAFITKKENKKIPIAGKFFHSLCYIEVDRDDRLQSLEAFKHASEVMSNNAASIGVFPEGTRQSEKVIGDFHEGVFNIAIHAKAPIVVTALKNTDSIHKRYPRFTKVKFDVVAVIPYEEYEGLTAKAVSDKVHEMMESHLESM